MPESDNLAVLRRMRSEGQISKAEYENLTRGLGHTSTDVVDEVVSDDPEEPPAEPTGEPTSVPGFLKLIVAGVAAVAAILIFNVLTSADDAAPSETGAVVTLPPQDPYPPIAGSLDIYMAEVTDAWNSVEGQPRISRGLTRYNETGEYDTIIYRFGDWGRLAGAYDPHNEMLYALMVTGQFSAPATHQLYLRLCYLVAPFSQDCIDSYLENGLQGGALEDFEDIPHRAEWELDEQTWRLEIDHNVLTVRVFGADAA